MAAEASWHWNYITVTQCIKGITEEHVSGMAVRGRVTHWIFTKDTTRIHIPFNGPFSGTTRVSRYQKGKNDLDFTEARDSEWQWHQLGHMQVCTSLQTDNHANTHRSVFLQAGCPSCRPTNSVKALKAKALKAKDTSWQNTGVNRVSSPSSIICWSRVQRNESKEVHIPYHIIHHATYMHTLFRIATSISSNSFVQKCSAVIYFDMEHNCGMTTYRSLV